MWQSAFWLQGQPLAYTEAFLGQGFSKLQRASQNQLEGSYNKTCWAPPLESLFQKVGGGHTVCTANKFSADVPSVPDETVRVTAVGKAADLPSKWKGSAWGGHSFSCNRENLLSDC